MSTTRRVITYGTFDLFHVGHVRLLKRARALGGYLAVGLSTDEFNLIKGKKCAFRYAERLEILRSVSYVDEVFPETCWEQKLDDLKRVSADIFVIGDDWRGQFDFLMPHCQVVYLPRMEGISSTSIKDELRHQ